MKSPLTSMTGDSTSFQTGKEEGFTLWSIKQVIGFIQSCSNQVFLFVLYVPFLNRHLEKKMQCGIYSLKFVHSQHRIKIS